MRTGRALTTFNPLAWPVLYRIPLRDQAKSPGQIPLEGDPLLQNPCIMLTEHEDPNLLSFVRFD